MFSRPSVLVFGTDRNPFVVPKQKWEYKGLANNMRGGTANNMMGGGDD